MPIFAEINNCGNNKLNENIVISPDIADGSILVWSDELKSFIDVPSTYYENKINKPLMYYYSMMGR